MPRFSCGLCETEVFLSGGLVQCPNCGHAVMAMVITESEGFGVMPVPIPVQIEPELRDTAARYEEVRHLLQDLLTGLGEVSDEAVERSRKDIRTVFVNLWSLREWVIAAGVPAKDVDATLDLEPVMALAHDIGNHVKHGDVKRPRSKASPSFGSAFLHPDPLSKRQILRQIVLHAGDEHEALDVATKAAMLWDGYLTGWGLMQQREDPNEP